MQTRWSSAGRSPLWALVALASILPLAGCRAAAAPPPVPTSGHSHGVLNAPLYGAADPTLATAVGLGLVQLDPASGRITGELARSWRHNRGFTRYRFRLRQGLATAVAARLTAVRLPGLASATAAGARTVSIRLAAPDPGFVAYLANPATWLPSGGPYRIAARSGTTITLERNPGFVGPAPAIRRVSLRVYPAGDVDAAFADFRAGRLDYALVPPGQIALAQSDPKLARGLISQPRLELVAVGIGPLAPGLRRAVALATPASAASADVGPGSSIPADGLIPQGLAQYLPDASPYGFDPAAARAVRPGDGQGLRLAYPDDAFHRRIAGVVLGGFAAAGLRVKPHPIPPARYRPAVVARTNPLWLIDARAPAPSAEAMLDALAEAAPGAGIVRTGDPDAVQQQVLTAARIAPLRFELSTVAVSRKLRSASIDVMGVAHLAAFANLKADKLLSRIGVSSLVCPNAGIHSST